MPVLMLSSAAAPCTGVAAVSWLTAAAFLFSDTAAPAARHVPTASYSRLHAGDTSGTEVAQD
jgi:hypothetical protein